MHPNIQNAHTRSSCVISSKTAKRSKGDYKHVIYRTYEHKLFFCKLTKRHIVSGCVAFIGVAIYFLSRPSIEVNFQEKLVFAAYFAGAIVCLGLSFAFHTVHCHSQSVGKLFSKLVCQTVQSYVGY